MSQNSKIIFDPTNSDITITVNNVHADATGGINIQAGSGITITDNMETITISSPELTSHIGNINNPHNVTTSQIGAATQVSLNSHTTNTNNPHNTTCLQIGAEPANTNIQSHIGSTSNPHNVTTSQIGAASIGDIIPSGTVIWSARTSAPAGYIVCEGQAVSRITYSNLFFAIGTLYGSGDGSTTFNVPNLKGQFIRGADPDNGRSVSNTFINKTKFITHNHASLETHGHTSPPHTHSNVGHNHNIEHIHDLSWKDAQCASGTAVGKPTPWGTGTYRKEGIVMDVDTTNSENKTIAINSETTTISSPVITQSDSTLYGDSETAPQHIILLPCIKI